MRKFEVGEWIIVYDGGLRFPAKLTEIGSSGLLHSASSVFHPKQCRKIKPKKKKHRVEGWVNVYESGPRSMWHKTKETADDLGIPLGRIACARAVIVWES